VLKTEDAEEFARKASSPAGKALGIATEGANPAAPGASPRTPVDASATS